MRKRSKIGAMMAVAAVALALALPSVALAIPANDNFADAQVIVGEPVWVNGTNVGATVEAGEPWSGNSWDDETPDTVWYRWTAPFTGTAVIDTCVSDFDTIVNVSTGSALDSLDVVANKDGGCEAELGGNDRGTRVTFDVTKDTTYNVQVRSDYNWDAGYYYAGTFTLKVSDVTYCLPGQVCRGTALHDYVVGSRNADTVKAGGGQDRVYANAGNDVAYGGDDRDVMYGGVGADRLYGGDGKDLVYSNGDRASDSVDCGAGRDIVYRDKGTDTVKNCEVVRRNYSGDGGYY
jgi:Ca2+-binding RTX toxin-like protein